MKQEKTTVSLLGIPFENRSRKEIEQVAVSYLSGAHGKTVFTPNAEILYRASRDHELKGLFSSADLLLPDGVGVTLAARMRGTPLRARYAGIDFGEWLLRYAAENGLSVFLLGGKDGVAEAARERLCAKLQDLTICGVHHGYFEKDGRKNERILSLIREKKPDLLLVCLGFPTQERWIAENLSALPSVRLAVGLGGSLDVWSGTKARAPKAMQAIGMEWLWRALSSPAHLKRLPYLPAFLLKAVWGK